MPPIGFWGCAPMTFSLSASSAAAFTPGLAEEGDVLIAALVTHSALPAAPAGWTQLATFTGVAARLTVFRRAVQDDEPGQHVFPTGAETNAIGLVLLFRGTAPAAALVASASSITSPSSATHVLPSAALTNITDMALYLALINDPGGTATGSTPDATLRCIAHGSVIGGGGSLAALERLPEAIGAPTSPILTWSTGGTGLAAILVLAAEGVAAAEVLPFAVPGAIGFTKVGV